MYHQYKWQVALKAIQTSRGLFYIPEPRVQLLQLEQAMFDPLSKSAQINIHVLFYKQYTLAVENLKSI